jgi:hypothetical protein
VTDYFAPLEIYDKHGADVLKKWKDDGPSLFLGVASHELPNMFVIYGPNTVIMIITIDCCWSYLGQ